MAKVEDVLEALRHCLPATETGEVLTCDTCPYYRCGDGVMLSSELVNDIRELLNSQLRNPVIVCQHCGKRIC